MPQKDPLAYRLYKKEQMRKRRAALKGESDPEPAPADATAPTPVTKCLDTSQRKPKPPAREPEPLYEQQAREMQNYSPRRPKVSLNAIPGGFWTRFPGKIGRTCFITKDGDCCYDLNFPQANKSYYCAIYDSAEKARRCCYYRESAQLELNVNAV